MASNPTMESSRRIYAGLLHLYPQDFREEYASSMLQLFTDQYRGLIREGRRKSELAFLWLRTISDLLVSVLREHLASQRAALGLLEPVPGKPLPWKSVILVLVPGIVFLVGQIGQLTGEDWFFLLVRRAAYYLILPVLLVWFAKRKFPIWGLIPLGMLYRTLFDVGYRVESILSASITRIFESPNSPIAKVYERFPQVIKVLAELQAFMKSNYSEVRVLVIASLLLIPAGLIILIARRRAFPRAAGIWTGVFLVLVLIEMFKGVSYFMMEYDYTFPEMIYPARIPFLLKYISIPAYSSLTVNLGFLLLILIGAVLARRHGRLAVLLPLGYLIPTVVFGRLDPNAFTPSYIIGASALVVAYRVIVTLIAPVWIVRSASDQAQMRAGAVGLLTAIGILVAGHIGFLLIDVVSMGMEWNWIDVYFTASPELIILAGIALAFSLYRWGSAAPHPRVAEPALSGI